jgi:hypothetical protein
MSKQPHIFNKINLMVETQDISTAKQLYQNLSDCVKDVILPQLELKLEKLGISEQHYIADTIDINIENVKPEKITETLTQEILREFDRHIIPMIMNEKRERDPLFLHLQVDQFLRDSIISCFR